MIMLHTQYQKQSYELYSGIYRKYTGTHEQIYSLNYVSKLMHVNLVFIHLSYRSSVSLCYILPVDLLSSLGQLGYFVKTEHERILTARYNVTDIRLYNDFDTSQFPREFVLYLRYLLRIHKKHSCFQQVENQSISRDEISYHVTGIDRICEIS